MMSIRNNGLYRPRWLQKLYAACFGYFWRPCAMCGRGHRLNVGVAICEDGRRITFAIFVAGAVPSITTAPSWQKCLASANGKACICVRNAMKSWSRRQRKE